MLQIYFSGSIRGGRQDAEVYQAVVKELKKYGNVLSEVVATEEVKIELTEEVDDKGIYDQDIGWLNEADVIVAEVTQPSLGVGFELGWATANKMQTLCLFHRSAERKLSAMVRGAHNGTTIRVVNYDINEIENILKDFMDGVVPKRDRL